MPRAGRNSAKFPDDLSMLDDLIRRYYRELLRSVEEHVKLGDFIKMIELRRKLAPSDSEQKRFWRMLERIRQEALRQDDVKPPTHKKRVSKKRQTREPK